MREGPLAALDAIEQATGEREANVIGYCLGGTLLACALAWLAAKGEAARAQRDVLHRDDRLHRAGRAGRVHRREHARQPGEEDARARRYLEGTRDGDHLQSAARQRSDLVVRGEQLSARQGPVPVRSAVLELRRDAHAGEDAHVLSAQHVHQEPAGEAGRHHARRRADRHFQSDACRSASCPPSRTTSRPGRSTYMGALLLAGPVKFMLGGSGHIAGIVNPPAANKYHYWTNPTNWPRPPTSGWPMRSATTAPGGRPGTSGAVGWAARKCRRAPRARAS